MATSVLHLEKNAPWLEVCTGSAKLSFNTPTKVHYGTIAPAEDTQAFHVEKGNVTFNGSEKVWVKTEYKNSKVVFTEFLLTVSTTTAL